MVHLPFKSINDINKTSYQHKALACPFFLCQITIVFGRLGKPTERSIPGRTQIIRGPKYLLLHILVDSVKRTLWKAGLVDTNPNRFRGSSLNYSPANTVPCHDAGKDCLNGDPWGKESN